MVQATAHVGKVMASPGDAAVAEDGAVEECATAETIQADPTPQEFYAEMVAREDIRAILAELAKN
jgi:hypothetical protein